MSADLVEWSGYEPAWCEQRPPEGIAVEAVLRFVVVGDVKSCLVAADSAH